MKDANGNIFTVPAGFKIVVSDDTNNAKTVDKGIVIEDATETATKGSQFVWIPVGEITKSDGTKVTVELGRYDFDSSTGTENSYSGKFVEEDKNDTSNLKKYGNTIAKNITNFKSSAIINQGYYVGRYEARTGTTRYDASDGLTQVTEKKTGVIYNFVTQMQAAKISGNMYNNTKFTSDLMNSYTWDTTITFIQRLTNKTNYANQKSENEKFEIKGTTTDVQCNIYDLASNVGEWTTETSSYEIYPCVYRGGYCGGNDVLAGSRKCHYMYNNYQVIGFRPILYINN